MITSLPVPRKILSVLDSKAVSTIPFYNAGPTSKNGGKKPRLLKYSQYQFCYTTMTGCRISGETVAVKLAERFPLRHEKSFQLGNTKNVRYKARNTSMLPIMDSRC